MIAAVITVLAFIAGLLIAPDIFYDQFIWKYFWGPVVADAADHSVSYHGIRAVEGYTLLSEFIYGMLLLAVFYSMYRFFKFFNIQINTSFFIASLPFIILGSTLRVLEDSGLYEKPLSYFFISPLIYVQVGIYFFLSILLGIYVERSDKKNRLFIPALVFINAAYMLFYLLFTGNCKHPVHPLIMILFSIVSLALFMGYKKKNLTSSMFFLGLVFLLPSLYLVSLWVYGDRWGKFTDVNLSIVPLVLSISALITFLTFFFARKYKNSVYSLAINLSLIFSHMIDGWTSYFAVVDPLKIGISYGEKHPIPLFLMKNFYGLGYPLVKLAIIIGIIYAMDIYLKEGLIEKPILVGLIKFFVLMLGLAPGLRDMLRIVMGI